MDNLIVATQTGGILGPFALILGKILEVIYDGFAALGIYNIGFCIILFTIVVRMLMLPMTIKQQKFTKLNSVMNPEIQAIQKKYKDKKDQASQMEMQEEIKKVYDKYGTSPTGSCLQLIIQMPILFALYRVIMNIPAYVSPVKDLYIKIITGLDSSQMAKFFVNGKKAFDVSGKDLTDSQINKCIDAMTGYAARSKGGISLAKGIDINDILAVGDKSASAKINSLYDFFGFNLGLSPKQMYAAGMFIGLCLVIPIAAGLFQFLSVQLTQKLNKSAMSQDNPMAGSMKMMNVMMPLISVYMCWILQTGIGIYWVAGSLIMMLQQFFINMHLSKIDVQDIINQNKEKAAEKAEKRKAKQGIYRERVLEASKGKNIGSTSNMTQAEKEAKVRAAKEKAANSGSIASKARMVKRDDK